MVENNKSVSDNDVERGVQGDMRADQITREGYKDPFKGQ